MTRIGVHPPYALAARQRLFRVLADVNAVTFVPLEHADGEDMDALISFSDRGNRTGAVSDIRRLEYVTLGESGVCSAGEIRFSDSSLVDSRIRGQSVTVSTGSPQACPADEPGEVLAHCDRWPIWRSKMIGGCRVDVVGGLPEELRDGESLREVCHSQAGVIIPLVHFLRELTGYSEWARPPLRAAFVIDDPNLHWPTYGFVSFATIARHAREHGYHVAFATIPLDAWFTHERAARVFRQARPQLSLAVHGNDHRRRDLELIGGGDHATRALRSSLGRIERLEGRANVSVSRVMVPPHGVCPDRVYGPLVAAGFEALCREPRWWRGRPEPLRSLGGWGMADTSHAGLPVLPRHVLSTAERFDELLIGALLDQPMIAFGHARELADGYERLAALARRIGTLGAVRWGSLQDIARSNYMTRTHDTGRLTVKLFARRVLVMIQAPVTEIVVELPPRYPVLGREFVVCEGRTYELERTSRGTVSAPIGVNGGAPTEIRLVRSSVMSTAQAPPQRRLGRAAVRRGATELRDRLEPFLRKGVLKPAVRHVDAAVRGLAR
jgi:hypothetical protein